MTSGMKPGLTHCMSKPTVSVNQYKKNERKKSESPWRHGNEIVINTKLNQLTPPIHRILPSFSHELIEI